MLRRMSSGRDGMPFAGAFLISRLGGSRRRFGRTIALWGFNRFLLFAAPSVLVPPDQSTHLPCIVRPRQRRRNRPDKPNTLNNLPAARRLRPSRLLIHGGLCPAQTRPDLLDGRWGTISQAADAGRLVRANEARVRGFVASLRTAAKRTLIVAGARFFCSRKKRYRRTTVRLNARRGSEQYQPMNSSIACAYDSWKLAAASEFNTALLAASTPRVQYGGRGRRLR